MVMQDFFGQGEQIDRDASGNVIVERRNIAPIRVSAPLRGRTAGVAAPQPVNPTAPVVGAASINDAFAQRIQGAEVIDPMLGEIRQTNAALNDQNTIFRESANQYKQEKLALAGAQFAVTLINADAAYRQAAGAAQFNIMMARNQANDALYRGRLRAGQAKSEARTVADSAILSLAAQGQDVSGTGVGRVESSIEAMGEQNAMMLEINGIKEALGFQLEEVNYNYQLENAAINRDMTILSSALNLGAQAYGVM